MEIDESTETTPNTVPLFVHSAWAAGHTGQSSTCSI